MQRSSKALHILSSFQSAPGREAGRCVRADRFRTGGRMFQSAPGREAGRCVQFDGAGQRDVGFNPRPAVRPGDAQRAAVPRDHLGVSIRARP